MLSLFRSQFTKLARNIDNMLKAVVEVKGIPF